MEYWSTAQAAEIWGIGTRRVQLLCENGKVDSAKRLGHMWLIPVGTPKPIDGRTKAAREKKQGKNDI